MTTEAGALEAIVLAAGAGSRFGGGKLTSRWGNGRLIDGALDVAFAAPVRHVTVVIGADEEVGPAAIAFAEAISERARLRLVHAEDHAAGMAASLRAGLAALPADTRGAFVLLGDMPAMPHDLPAKMARAMAASGAAACAPTCGGVRGHPVLFAAELFDALAALSGDLGARRVLDGLGERLVLIETADRGVLFDVDRRV